MKGTLEDKQFEKSKMVNVKKQNNKLNFHKFNSFNVSF